MVRTASILASILLVAATPAAAEALPARSALAFLQPDRDWRGGGWRGGNGRGRDAREMRDERQDFRGRGEGRRAPLQQVLRSIESRTPGRLLDASAQDLGGRAVYRVRWATDDGRRLDYLVDAVSGQILSAE